MRIERNTLHLFLPGILVLIFIFIINVGIIFKIPYPIVFGNDFIYELSKFSSNKISIDITIGILSIILISFGVINIFFSLKHMPLKIFYKYILLSRKVKQYLSFQFALLSVGLIFSNFDELPKFDFYIQLFLIPISLIMTLDTAKNILKMSLPPNLWELVINGIKIKSNPDIEKKVEKNKNEFLTKLKDLNEKIKKIKKQKYDFYKIDMSEIDFLFFYSSTNTFHMKTDKKGILFNINLERFHDIIKDHIDNIYEVQIFKTIGSTIPEPFKDPTSIEEPNSLFIIKFAEDISYERNIDVDQKTEAKEDDTLEKTLNNIKQNQKELEKAFEIKDNIINIHAKSDEIDDIILIITYLFKNNELEFDNFFDLIQKFLRNIYKNININKFLEINYYTYLYKIFLLKFYDLISSKMTENLLDKIYSLIYSISFQSIKMKNLNLFILSINGIQEILFNIIKVQPSLSHHLEIINLRIKELTFSYEMIKSGEDEDFQTFKKSWNNFYEKIIAYGIQKASTNVYLLINYYNDLNLSERDEIIKRNVQYLIEFLENLFTWRNYLKKQSDAEFRKIQEIFEPTYTTLAKYITYLSIYIFFKVKHKMLPEYLLKEVAFPMAEQCHSGARHFGKKANDYLTEFFYDYFFDTPFEFGVSSWFEATKIHKAGSYSPALYSFNEYWYNLSFYRFKLQQSEPFIPSKKPEQENTYGIRKLKNYKRTIQSKQYKIFCHKSNEDMERAIAEFKNKYIFSLKEI